MLELLAKLFRQVRTYMLSERFKRNQVYGQFAGHTTMVFDREAEDIILKGLTESGLGFEVISEERPAFSTLPSPPYRIVIDPVDGSTNIMRGITTAGVSLAVLPIDAPISPEQVQWALVGELFSGTIYQAERGSGALCNGERCHVSETTRLQDCLAGVNFDGRDLETLRKLIAVPPPLSKVRRTGSSALDIVYVASGAYDAYIDSGDVITAESFLASLSIVLAAGGIVSDQHGKSLRHVTNLTEGFSLVAAGTRELHEAILARFQSQMA
jgi:myo-inositol-1(or 4)-monophosphatase